MSFVNLHNYSNFSILQALPSPDAIIKRAKELGQEAVALTDRGTLAGAWSAHKAAKEAGIKLIIGCDFFFAEDRNKEKDPQKADKLKVDKLKHLVLLATNHKSYKNLLLLNKLGFDSPILAGRRVLSVIDWELLEKHSKDLICLTGCGNGIVSQYLNTAQPEKAEENLLRLKKIFGASHLGVEMQSHNLIRGATHYDQKIDQVFTNRQLNKLAIKHELRVVATSNAFYLQKEEAELHDVLLAIGSMQPISSNFRPKYINAPDFYLKSREETIKFFSRNYGDGRAKEMADNTVYFANLCEDSKWIDPKFSNPSGKELPIFPIQDAEDYQDFTKWIPNQSDFVKNLPADQAYLRFKCDLLLKSRIPAEKQVEYGERVQKELDTFEYQNASSYMLIVADYIAWARKNGVSVGVSRGSVAGSLCAYLLDIHRVDSIKYGLVFERFYNKLKKDYSDIDSDFSKAGRQKVIDYVANKYGKDRVAGISNLVGITPKIYVRDLSRSAELGGDRKKAVEIGNKLADSFLAKCKSMDEVVANSPLFNEYTKEYPLVLKHKKICGAPRGLSTHAAGIVIGSRDLHQIIPLRKDKDNNVVVEYDKVGAEENGLVKMDFLGLSTLDIIDKVKELIKINGKEVPEIDIEAYDEKTYDLITSGNTYGVFQFGTSGGTIDLCKKIEPKCIEDLAIITTIARPASADIREAFIRDRKTGSMAKLIHPSLKNALKNSFGHPIYDESLLTLSNDVAGWDLAEADKLRKLTKEKGKNPKKAEQWHKEFIEGAATKGISAKIADNIWVSIIEPFGRYSFNKAHAVGYSMISYETAYLKAHFPIEFLLANLMHEISSNTPDAENNILRIKKEIRQLGIKILPPDINSSLMHYQMQNEKTLLTGIEALKFVSEDAINEILEKRPFKDFHDFMLRCDTSKMRSNAIQALAAAGCLDSFKISRKQMFLYCSEYRKKLQVWLKRHDPETEKFDFPFPDKKDEWTKSEIFALEKFYMGEVFSVKKAEAYGPFFQKKDYAPLAWVRNRVNKEAVSSIRAEIKSVFELKVKKEGSRYLGMDMAKVAIEDANGSTISMTIFPDNWEQAKKRVRFEPGVAIHFAGTTNLYNGEMGIVLDRLLSSAAPPALPKDLKHKKIVKEKDEPKDILAQELEADLFTDEEHLAF